MRRKNDIPPGCATALFIMGLVLFVIMEMPWLIWIILIIVAANLIVKSEEEMKKKNQEQEYQSLDFLLEKIDNMTGLEFEKFLIEKILEKDGFTNIEGTKYIGDYGVDIIAYKDGIKCAIQCKRANSKISNKAIQEVAAGRKHYKCEKAIVISNNYYTENAKELAFDNKVLLLDRDYLIKMLKKI